MEPILNIQAVADAIGGKVYNLKSDQVVLDVSTDSRTIPNGALFFALKGENFDGHKFVDSAIKSGAVAAVVSEDTEELKKLPVIVVEDTLAALRNLAEYYRMQFSISVVGVTGSVGKTSTKEMIASVLEQKYQTHKTKGNFNNEIGVPLTAYQLSQSDEMAVIEMGMSDFGEISRLTRIAKPDTAVITNIGMSHIEHLGSQEGIKKAKLEILEGLQPEGTVVLNGDDPLLWDERSNIDFETLFYGIGNKNCDVVAYDIKTYSDGSEFTCNIDGEPHRFNISVAGEHHIYNALAAILIGLKYNVPVEEIKKGIKAFAPVGMRQAIIELPQYTIIRDCYNASPDSMKSGLDVLSLYETEGRRVACLGDMLELGDATESAHKMVGKMAAEKTDVLITVGKASRFIAEGAKESGMEPAKVFEYESKEALYIDLDKILEKNDVILIKGSRGMQMEKVADAIVDLA